MKTRGRSGFGPGVWMTLIVATTACVDVVPETPRAIPLEEAEAAVRHSLCERVFNACRCDQWSWYDTEEECNQDVAEAVSEIQDVLDGPMGGSLTYDPTCMGTYVRVLDDLHCDTESDDSPQGCQTPCQLVHGTLTEGQPCELFGEWISDCAPGLVCYGTCGRPCGGVSGSFAAEGESCVDRPCDEGLLCDFGGDEICRVAPEAGSPCVQGQCATGAFCETTDPLDPMSEQLCYAPRGIDEPCRGHDQCTSGLCPAGFCAVAPKAGESCQDFGVCEPGFSCVDGVCGLGDSLLCSVPVPSV